MIAHLTSYLAVEILSLWSHHKFTWLGTSFPWLSLTWIGAINSERNNFSSSIKNWTHEIIGAASRASREVCKGSSDRPVVCLPARLSQTSREAREFPVQWCQKEAVRELLWNNSVKTWKVESLCTLIKTEFSEHTMAAGSEMWRLTNCSLSVVREL